MTDAPLEPREVALLLWQRRKLVIAVPLCVGLVALGIAFLIPKTYTATTTIVPPAQQSSSALSAVVGQLGALGGLAAGGALKTQADVYLAFLKSRNVLDKIVERFGLQEVYQEELREDARAQLVSRSRFSLGKKDGLITIEVDDRSPQRASDIANAYVDELRRLNSELAVGEAAQRRAFFEGQLAAAKGALARAEDELSATGVSSRVLNSAPQAAVAAVAKLKANVTAHEIRISSLQGYVTEDHPDLKQARLELAALQAQLVQLEDGGPVPDSKSKYTEKYRNYKYQETMFELMAKQYELARLDEAREGNVMQVLDIAIPPERKSKPKKAQISLAAMGISWLLVVVALVAHHYWRTRRPFGASD